MHKNAYYHSLREVEEEFVYDGREISLTMEFFDKNLYQLPFYIEPKTIETKQIGYLVTNRFLSEKYETHRVATLAQLNNLIDFVAQSVQQNELANAPEEPDQRLDYFEEIYQIRESFMNNVYSYLYGLDIQQSKSHKHMPADIELLAFVNYLKAHTVRVGNNSNHVFDFENYVLLVFSR